MGFVKLQLGIHWTPVINLGFVSFCYFFVGLLWRGRRFESRRLERGRSSRSVGLRKRERDKRRERKNKK